MPELVFLKFGGSLITDKNTPHTARMEIIQRLAQEIEEARNRIPGLHLLLGHGSGSFGHVPASLHGTREGVRTHAEWHGFAEVWREARVLNQLVVEALAAVHLPVIAFPPSALIIAKDGQPVGWDIRTIEAALQNGLVPLVNGDVVFDTIRGGTILSTEEVFAALAFALRPTRVLMAGIEPGVWADFPSCTHIIEHITPVTFQTLGRGLGSSASIDVTGGMRQKVELMLHLIQRVPELEALIFSGSESGAVRYVLEGGNLGTRISR
jgi:isopentenyl phosphate kinase